MEDQSKEKQTDHQQQVIQFMTTEHFTLQTARSATIAEANGRTMLYLNSVSAAVVALAFIGQASEMSEPFLIFALVLFPCLFFLGLVTLLRVRQTGIEDMVYGRGINRIRHYYLEIAPEMEKYFILSKHDDMIGLLQNMAVPMTFFQQFVSTSGTVMVINCVIGGVFITLLVSLFLELPLLGYVLIGVVVFVVLVVLHGAYFDRNYKEAEARLKVMFPSDEK